MAGVLASVVVEAGTFLWLEDYPTGSTMVPILLGLIMVAAASGSGVARGRELLGRGGQAAIIVLLLVASLRSTPGINWGVRQAILLVAAAVVAGLLVRTAAGRRAAIVLAAPLSPLVVPLSPLVVPLSPLVVPFFPGYIDDGLTRFLVGVVAVAAVGSVAALATIVMLERLTGWARRRT